jgi:hypothetical protein
LHCQPVWLSSIEEAPEPAVEILDVSDDLNISMQSLAAGDLCKFIRDLIIFSQYLVDFASEADVSDLSTFSMPYFDDVQLVHDL